jgi:peptide-methionine (S)-S-oxide reductase
MEKATFAAGCFWGVEARFQQLPGVSATAVGYEGGSLASPTYQQVCTDRSGHAEAVEIDFDPSKISYQQLLDEFFALHDPTQLNRQGPDWGSQYRSVVFYRSPEQEKAAKETIARLTAEKRFSKPVVTQVVPAETFWRAEDYHQKYLEKRGAVSCHI